MFRRNGAEKFLVLDIVSSGTNGLFLRMTEDHEIVLEKFMRGIDLPKFLSSPLHRATQASWEGEYLFDGHRKILAAASSSLATTVPMPVSFRREPDRRHLAVTLEELDDCIGRILPKLTSQCHMEAAKRFGDDAVEAVLVGASVRHMTIDGKATMHPLGFQGDEVSFTLEFTFARRPIFESLRALFNSPEPFFFAESAQVRLAALASVRPLPLNLIVAGEDSLDATLFVLQAASARLGPGADKKSGGGPVLYRERFPWSSERTIASLEESFSLSRAAAGDVYRAYVEEGVSDTAKRAIGHIFDESAERFSAAVRKTKIRGHSYVDASFPPPFPLPHHAGRATVEDIPFDEICAKFGVSIRDFEISKYGNIEISPGVLWRHVAPFLRMYFDHDQAAMNGLLRKRVHWLTN